MNDFFSELKRFVENHQDTPTADVYILWEESKIQLNLAREIYASYFIMLNDYNACLKDIDEPKDFIRLLREENMRLRGGKAQ